MPRELEGSRAFGLGERAPLPQDLRERDRVGRDRRVGVFGGSARDVKAPFADGRGEVLVVEAKRVGPLRGRGPLGIELRP